MKLDKKEDIFKGIEKISVKSRVINEIRSMVLNGQLAPGDRLPGEYELSEKMNISRGALRDALQILERTGFIVRRHGVGTFISENPLRSDNLNINWGLTTVIESSGDVPGSSKMEIFTKKATEFESKKLDVPVGESIVVLERVRTANGVPIAYTLDQFPESILKTKKADISIDEMREFFEAKQSLLTFFRKVLKVDLHHAIASIGSMVASEEVGGRTLAEILDVPEDSKFLLIEQTEYLADERPALYVQEYHLSGYLTFNIYRSY